MLNTKAKLLPKKQINLVRIYVFKYLNSIFYQKQGDAHA